VLLRKGRAPLLFKALWLCLLIGSIFASSELELYFLVPILSFCIGAGIYSAKMHHNVSWFDKPSQLTIYEVKNVSLYTLLKYCILGKSVLILFSFLYSYIYKTIFSKSKPALEKYDLLSDCLLLFDCELGTFCMLICFIFYSCICVSILEEIFFRGVLQEYFSKYCHNYTAVLLVSVLFGLLHGLSEFLPKFLGGLFYGWMFIKFRSLIPSIIAHIFNNSVVALALMALYSYGNIDKTTEKLNAKRAVQVLEDSELKGLVSVSSPDFNREHEMRLKAVYETSFRQLLQTRGYSESCIEQSLNIWVNSKVEYWNVKSKLTLETPENVGDRRNAWRVRRWDAHSKSLLKEVEDKRDDVLLGLLRDRDLILELKNAVKLAVNSNLKFRLESSTSNAKGPEVKE
jgi:membrane protease YdiL (CAAX protease family)